jgi:hypothetical protein
MRPMQAKVLDKIESLVEGTDYEAVRQAQYDNVGRVYVQLGFETVLDIHYDFQPDSCSFDVYSPKKDPSSDAHLVLHRMKYRDGEKFNAFFDSIQRAVRDHSMEEGS